jgi:uncharacterized membrane protein YqiK
MEEIEKVRIRKEKALEAERSLRETTLTEEIETRRKHRNDVERETELAILAKNLEVELRALDIEREKAFARLQQQQEIAARKAEQEAEIATREAEGERSAEVARIRTSEAVEKARIEEQKTIELERIRSRQETERLEIQRRMAVEVEDRERNIAVLRKELEKAVAEAETEEARAKVAEAMEKVVSARETEIAERRKQIELIEAARTAQAEALQITTISQAQAEAAEQRAEAERFSSLAARLRYEVDAEGKRMLNEAENMRSGDNRKDALRMKLVEHLEGIIRESVKPMEQISDIKILQVDGMPGLSGSGLGNGNGTGGGGNGSDMDGPGPGGGALADNIVSSALRYRVQAPFVDKLLNEIGMSGGDITKIGNLLKTVEDKGD